MVLDVGFWGQAVGIDNPEWVHNVLRRSAKEVYGVDITYDDSALSNPEHYQRASAESFHFDTTFDVIFASELIEHLTNPGLFLEQCKKHLTSSGALILTTPNTFGFMTLIQKMFKKEPSVNPDHTMYFNKTVLETLLNKCGFTITKCAYIATFQIGRAHV